MDRCLKNLSKSLMIQRGRKGVYDYSLYFLELILIPVFSVTSKLKKIHCLQSLQYNKFQ